MTVKPVDNYRPTTAHTIKTALKAGALTAAVQGIMLPAEAKSAVINTIVGKDIFMQNATKAGLQTIKNLDLAGFEKTASKINIRETLETANQMYPEIVKVGKPILKELGKTFAWVASSIVIGSFIADKLFTPKSECLKCSDSRNSTTA